MVFSKKKQLVNQHLTHFLLIAIAFFIPLYARIVPTLIALLLINWFIEGAYIKTIPLIFKEKNRLRLLYLTLIYFFYLVGLTWSSDMHAGWFDVQVKLSLFVFPWVFATSAYFPFQRKKLNTILISFITGCFSLMLILYGHASYELLVNKAETAFYYEALSWYNSPIYLAMYLSFAMAVLGYWIIEGYHTASRFQLTVLGFVTFNFFVFLILLNSKAGYLSLFMVVAFYSGYLIVIKKRWVAGIGCFVVCAMLFLGSLLIFPFTGDRLAQAQKEITSGTGLVKDPKSTTERILVWQSSLEVIREHLVIGVGTGDVNAALQERYLANHHNKLLSKKLNAHNQYLQTFIALGAVGFLFLLLILFVPAVMAFQRKDLLYLLFLIIVAVNLLTESMFERQAGIFFYAMFNALFFASDQSDPVGNPADIPFLKS